ncbi:MAG: RES family NAD+ phosphorylase [Chitinophagaceae bacterium]|nr:RES family NAD+ phosphorylase [Chitinophagaceae bacterium]
MIVYRFAAAKYSRDISGEGSRLFGGRWNSKGNAVLYTSITISLSLLEMLIHSSSYDEIKANVLVTIDVPELHPGKIPVAGLTKNWQSDIDYCRYIGDAFITEKQSLLLKVPSVIVPEEHNLLINPAHPAFKKVKVLSAKKFAFDTRMFKN